MGGQQQTNLAGGAYYNGLVDLTNLGTQGANGGFGTSSGGGFGTFQGGPSSGTNGKKNDVFSGLTSG